MVRVTFTSIGSALLMASILLLHTPVAQAATITNTFTFDLANLQTNIFPDSSTGLPRKSFMGSLSSQLTPFSIDTGDTLITTVNFTGGVFTLQDFGSPAQGDNETAIINYFTDSSAQFTATDTHTITFHGATGDLNSGASFNSNNFSYTGRYNSIVLFNSLVETIGTFTGFTITSEIHSISDNSNVFGGARFVFLTDQPVPVPATGALALLGLGLFGLGWRRQTA